MQRSLAFLLAATLGASACATDDSSDLGGLDLSLVGQAPSGTTYRLRDAVLTVDGPGGPITFHTEDDPNRAQINARLQSGAYTLTLATGWHLEKLVGGAGQPVQATLLSSHPLGFQVVAGEFTPVTLRFRAGADDVGLGEGDIGISIGVEEQIDAGAPAPVEIVATPSAAQVTEGDVVAVSVHLSGPIAAPLVVTAHGFGNIDVSPPSLTFTPANYQFDQLVIIMTVQDANIEDTTGLLRLSAPGLASRDVNVQVHDDDVLSLVTTTATVVTTEIGSTTFGVAMGVAPPAPVTVDLVTVGGGFTVTPAQLIFDPANLQTLNVTVTGVHDDDLVDATGLINLVSPGIATVTLPVTIDDVDAQSIVAPATLTLNEGSGMSVPVRLAFAPLGAVTVTAASNNAAVVTAAPSALTFTPSNWNLPQLLTIAATFDSNTQPESARITLSSPDIASAAIDVTVVDTTVINTLGWPTTGGSSLTIPSNELQVFRVQLTAPATLNQLQVIGGIFLTQGRLAIYREVGNAPGQLIFAGPSMQLNGPGQPTVQPVNGVTLQPGAYYLGVVASTSVPIATPPVPQPSVTRCRQSMSFGGAFPPTIAPANCQQAQPLSVAAVVVQ